MRRNRSRFWRQQKGLPVPRQSGFAKYSGATTPKRKPLGSVRMTSEKTTHTYLLAAPNLGDEIHLKGVSLVTSQLFQSLDLVLHCILIIIHLQCHSAFMKFFKLKTLHSNPRRSYSSAP